MKFLLAYFLLSLPFMQCIFPHHRYEYTVPPELALDYTAATIPTPFPTINDPDYNFDVTLTDTESDSEDDTDYPNINFNRLELPKAGYYVLDQDLAPAGSTDASFVLGEVMPDTLESILADLPRTTTTRMAEPEETPESVPSSSGTSGNKHHVLRKKIKKKN